MRWRQAGLAALLALMLPVGCGGDEPTQTKARFIDQADTACGNLAVSFAQAGAANPQTPQQIADANDQLADIYGQLGAGLKKLELPPGSDRAGAQAYVDAVKRSDVPLQQLRQSSQRLVAAANGRDPGVLARAGNDVRAALDAFRAARAASDRLAIAYGFNVCGGFG